MPWVTSIASFRDFMSVVIVCAPADFPVEDFLRDDEQLNLERAFAELDRGMELLARTMTDQSTVSELRALLKCSYDAYVAGEEIKGAHLLQDFEARAFGNGG
jgi:hypothetical protein